MYDSLKVRYCNYSSILIVPFASYLTLNNTVTLKSGLKLVLKLMPFKSLGAVSYSPSIVTMAVSVAVYEIFSVRSV